jgi:hypothetical protein
LEQVEKQKILYHGTRFGNNFEKFDLQKSNYGVANNAFSQGNNGIYLIDNKNVAKYFSRKASSNYVFFEQNKNTAKTGLTPDAKQIIANSDKSWNYLFGADATKFENVIEVKLDKNAKIKFIDFYPTKKDIENLISENKYDGVEFKEIGLQGVEDFPEDIRKNDVSGNTTFVWNLDKLQIVSQPKKEYVIESPGFNVKQTRNKKKAAIEKDLKTIELQEAIEALNLTLEFEENHKNKEQLQEAIDALKITLEFL